MSVASSRGPIAKRARPSVGGRGKRCPIICLSSCHYGSPVTTIRVRSLSHSIISEVAPGRPTGFNGSRAFTHYHISLSIRGLPFQHDEHLSAPVPECRPQRLPEQARPGPVEVCPDPEKRRRDGSDRMAPVSRDGRNCAVVILCRPAVKCIAVWRNSSARATFRWEKSQEPGERASSSATPSGASSSPSARPRAAGENARPSAGGCSPPPRPLPAAVPSITVPVPRGRTTSASTSRTMCWAPARRYRILFDPRK